MGGSHKDINFNSLLGMTNHQLAKSTFNMLVASLLIFALSPQEGHHKF
jgi:hypothetical protein